MTETPENGSRRPRRGWRDHAIHQTARRFTSRGNHAGETAAPKPPTMSRSRIQLTSTYAPGVLFTWEGAKGICRAVPIERELRNLNEATRLLIQDGIREIVSNWFDRATGIRQPNPVPIELILDDPFYDPRTGERNPNFVRFQFTDPQVMGYVPYPLLYRCAVCGHLEEYNSIEEQVRRPLPRRCGDHEPRWAQVDVVYVHWSGHLEPLSPFRNNFDRGRNEIIRLNQCQCGSRDFRLHNQSSVFSEWQFECEGCRRTRDLKQHDPRTYDILERQRANGGRSYEFVEVDMLPVSYRANSAFYPQKGSFIEFRDRTVVDLLLPERRAELLRSVAGIHGFAYTEPTDAEIEATLRTANRASDWADYTALLNMVRPSAQGERWRREAAALKESWYVSGLIDRGQVQSGALVAAIHNRGAWARRFDPLRLTIEHDRFRVEHISERRAAHEAVNVLDPDRLICDAVGDPAALQRYREGVGGLLRSIGVDELVLIRGLPICEFSFGYTRVSPTPVYHREFNGRQVPMPVRLTAFPEMNNGRRPIYVTQQKNEALYFKLDQARVRRWLAANGIHDMPPDQQSIGAAYLERYEDFKPFLERFKEREGRGARERDLCAYTYLLLHSLAHQVMHALADVSGLDSDGLGEHIFPADLAFVVYRKGMTPDLGNVSAMWRNHAVDFLRRILDPRLLRCGSGTLCDTRGGACPACIMVSEVSCIAANQLLSRASLRGGPGPLWEPQNSNPLVGFFDPGFAG